MLTNSLKFKVLHLIHITLGYGKSLHSNVLMHFMLTNSLKFKVLHLIHITLGYGKNLHSNVLIYYLKLLRDSLFDGSLVCIVVTVCVAFRKSYFCRGF